VTPNRSLLGRVFTRIGWKFLWSNYF
jgi:hypothetical protein